MSVKENIEALVAAAEIELRSAEGYAGDEIQRVQAPLDALRGALSGFPELPVSPAESQPPEDVQESAPAVPEPEPSPAEPQEPAPAVTPADPAPEPPADPSAAESPAETEQATGSQEPTV